MVVNVTAQLNAAAAGASASFCKFKYNKRKQIIMEFDDAAMSVTTAFDKLEQTFYTNGCGTNINYALGLAVNGRNQFNNAEFGFYDGYAATYAQRAPMIKKGVDIMNHSFYHEEAGNFNYGADRERNVRELDEMILLKEKYKMNTLVVPTSWPGFMSEAAAQGYIGGSSQNTFDNFPQRPLYNARGKVEDIPVFTYQAIFRDFTDIWNNTGVQWNLINALFADDTFNYFEIGTHGIAKDGQPENFNTWIDAIHSLANDGVIFSSLREFLEYIHVHQHVIKTETIVGNTVKITLDYSAVPNQFIRWFDVSMLLNSNAAIINVTTDDNSFAVSFNPETNLININKQKLVWGEETAPAGPLPEILVKRGRFTIN